MKKVHEDKRYGKKSLQALNVANEVIRRFKAGEKINLTEIQVRNGYHMTSARSQKAVKTKTYQSVVMPVVAQLEAIRAKSLQALLKKDHNKEKYRDLVEGVDKVTKNAQLLSGKATENMASNLVIYGSDDWLAIQKMKEGGAKE